MLVCETGFTDRHLDKGLSLDGYTLFCQDRIVGKGGGICAYVRSGVFAVIVIRQTLFILSMYLLLSYLVISIVLFQSSQLQPLL
jgi:hypothetical protein